jgi:vacuolar-type H+-ATPase subunit I/STV1
MTHDLIYRLRKRAEIRRQIDTRKSVQEGKPDRIADLLEEAANELEKLNEHLSIRHRNNHI